MRASRRCYVCVFGAYWLDSYLTLLVPSLAIFSLRHSLFTLHTCKHTQALKHTHTERARPYNSAPPGVCIACVRGEGRRDIETEWKKEILSVLYFVVPGFDMSISTFVVIPFLNTFLNLKSGSVPLVLSSSYIPAFLTYCDAFWVSARSLSVRHFRQDLQNVRRPKPGWQTKTLPSERWDLTLAKLGML